MPMMRNARGGHFSMSAEDRKGAGKRLMGYVLRHHRIRIAVVIVGILLSSYATVAGSMFIKDLIDVYIEPMLLSSQPDFGPLLSAILKMASIYLVGILAALLYNRTMVSISQGVLRDIRQEMFSHMQTLPIRYFDTHSHGDVMSYYTNDTDTLRQMIAQSLPQLLSSIVTVILAFAAMLKTSVALTAMVLCCLVLMMLTTKVVAGRSGRYFVRQQDSIGKVNGYIEEMVSGQKVVKVFCHEEAAKEGFDKLNDQLAGDAYKANKYANILMPLMANMGNLQYVLIAITGSFLVLSGGSALTLGDIISFLQLSRNFSNPISQMANQLNSVVMALAGAGRIFRFIDEQPEQDEGIVTLVDAKYDQNDHLVESSERTEMWAWKYPHPDGTVTYTRVRGDITLENVDFAYEEGKTILHDISLYAKPGQKVAFVGATGAGKTTITNLLNRFYDIEDGKIRYDGININKIRKSDLRRSLGIVLQDTNLFTGTVMENIRYGRLDATDEEVRQAARLANADDFISRLPKGYDTMLTSNGSELSQGQRQLIAIARAAVADPPVMILDEATSSIDTRTESLVQKGMDALMVGRTVFVIAHRLSTVRNSNAIMVLDHGRIIERGDHEQLIAAKGTYYQLYTGAFELE